MRFHLICCGLLFGLAACDDPITKAVNEYWPPIDVKHQRQSAIDTTAAALAAVTSPNIAVALQLADAQQVLFSKRLKASGISELSIKGEEQLLRVRMGFSKKFTGADVDPDGGPDLALKGLLDLLQPEVTGTITLYAGISGALAKETTPIPQLELRILPALSSVTIKKARLADKVDVTSAGKAISSVLNKYKDNITGELSRSTLMTATVPALASDPIDLGKRFRVDDGGARLDIRVEGKPVIAPARLIGIAWLVTESQIIALVQVVPSDDRSPADPVRIASTYSSIRDQIEPLAERAFAVPDSRRSTWVAVRKDLLAIMTNSVFSQAGVCISASGQSAKDSKKVKVDIPDGERIDCSSDRSCKSDRKCPYEPRVDRRDCSACILYRPRLCAWGQCVGGGCIERGRNPACALAQGIQNDLYRAEAAVKKADCERLKEMEKIGCEVDKAGKKLLCEAGKEILKRVAATGNFANVEFETHFQTNDLKVCLREFQWSTGLDNVQLTLDVKGTASGTIGLEFEPLDIVGHLTCQFPWQETKKFSAALRKSKLQVTSKVTLVTGNDNAELKFTTAKLPMKVRLDPGPTEILLTSKNMTLSCRGLDFIKPIAILLTPFVPELRGDFDYELAAQTTSLNLPLPTTKIGDSEARLSVKETPEAVVLFADIVQVSSIVSAQ